MDQSLKKRVLTLAWITSLGLAIGIRAWNALAGPMFHGYDAWAHFCYVMFLDLYRAIPYADQGWSYFHPPLHYMVGWLLAQGGSAEVLIRGLALLGSSASLGVALLASQVTRWGAPGRPLLPLVSFTAVAFLPVHLYVGPMPGNELTATLLSAAVIVLGLRNATRETPTLRGDLLTGVVAGLGMLTKFNVLLALAVACSLPVLRWGRSRIRAQPAPGDGAALVRRLLLILVPVLVLSGPFYARSIAEYGTPFQLSRDFPPMLAIESNQLPDERFLTDYLRVPPQLLEDAHFKSPHMLHAVWPNVYLNAWYDTHREGQLPFARLPIRIPEVQQLTLLMGAVGLIPTLLALLGAGVSARRLWRRLRSPDSGQHETTLDTTMLLLSACCLVAFILFSWRVPSFAALKSSYLLNLSLPFGYFSARAIAFLSAKKWHSIRQAAIASIVFAALVSTGVFSSGLLLKMREDSSTMGAAWLLFGELEKARNVYSARVANQGISIERNVEPLAAIHLLAGRSERAKELYQRALQGAPEAQPLSANRLAVAMALNGDTEEASELLESALSRGDHPVLLVNRGILFALGGKKRLAEASLRRAVRGAPKLACGWSGLAELLLQQGRKAEAGVARHRARAAAENPPRRFAYGIGNGHLFKSGGSQRWMLGLGDNVPTLCLPQRSRLQSGQL